MRLPGLFKGLSYPRAVIRSPALVLPGATKKQGAGSGGGPSAATQTDEENGTSTAVYTSPGTQHFHLSAAKCFAYITVSAGTPTLQSPSLNIAGIADTAAGQVTVTIDTDFSSANWSSQVTCAGSGGGFTSNYSSKAAGSIILEARQATDGGEAGNLTDPTSYDFAGFGDHA